MTRTLSKKLMWNGVIYGAAFVVALLVADFIDTARNTGPQRATAMIDRPAAETAPASSVADAAIR